MKRTEGLQQEYGHTCPWPAGPGAQRAAAGRRVANVGVEDHEEHSQDDHCLHLHATVRAQAERVLLLESTAIRGTWFPRASSRRAELERSTCVSMD